MAGKRKVVHLSSVHGPSDVRIFHKECKTLVEDGYDVVLVVASNENGVREGVRYRIVPKPVNRWQRMTRTITQVYFTALKEKGILYHFHDPELIPVGLLLKVGGNRVVYDVHEDLPRQILSKHWIPPWLRRMVAQTADILEVSVSRIFDGIVTVTPAIAGRFPPSKTIIVQNFPVLEELEMAEPCPYQHRPFRVAYVGAVTGIRGIREMIQAIAMIPERLQTRLAIAGSFDPPGLEKEAKTIPGWESVDFMGPQPRSGVARLLNQARVGLVLLHPKPNYMESYPVKMFEYMASGIPVVVSDFPLWRCIVEEARCGILVDPMNPQAIARAVQWLMEHPKDAEAMGKNGWKAARVRYRWEGEAQKLIAFYRRLLDEEKKIRFVGF